MYTFGPSSLHALTPRLFEWASPPSCLTLWGFLSLSHVDCDLLQDRPLLLIYINPCCCTADPADLHQLLLLLFDITIFGLYLVRALCFRMFFILEIKDKEMFYSLPWGYLCPQARLLSVLV